MKYEIIEHKENKFIYVPYLRKLGLKHVFTTSDMHMGIPDNFLDFEKAKKSYSENIDKIQDFFKEKIKNVDYCFLSHGSNFEYIKENRTLNFSLGNRKYYKHVNFDALISEENSTAIAVTFADCTPILIFDAKKLKTAVIHAGWKGSFKKITQKVAEEFTNKTNSSLNEIYAVIGPCILQDDFEIGKEVIERFDELYKDKKEFYYKSKEIGKYYFDLQALNKFQLLESGIKEENIIKIDISTYTSDLLHSYRRYKKLNESTKLMTVLSMV